MVHSAEKMLGFRLLLTDSGHYLLPTDNYSDNPTADDQSMSLLAAKEIERIDKAFGNMKTDDRMTFHEVSLEHTDLGPAECEQSQLEGSSSSWQPQVLNAKEKLVNPGMKQHWGGIPYEKDIFPEHYSVAKQKKLHRKYMALPEEFYTRVATEVVTPKTFGVFITTHRQSNVRWNLQESCSGSARFSGESVKKGLSVGFPVDLRYGWDVYEEKHRQMLETASTAFATD